MVGEIHCPLCRASNIDPYHQDRQRDYLQCEACDLVFVAPHFLPDPKEEKAEYDKHENLIDDAGYRGFLARVLRPLEERIAKGAVGLDYGCGPGPALVQMLRERGYEVAQYDPNYFPDTVVLGRRYDFVSATEVVEHMHYPGVDLERVWGLLEDGGWLAVMTKLVTSPEAFSNWHYIRDPTHVCFYSESTWRWWAGQYGAELEFVGSDVIFLRRPVESQARP